MIAHKDMLGSLTISRPRGADADYIELSITDEKSGTQFLSARIGLSDFAEALMGLGYVPCKFDLRADRVGLRYEHKEEFVPFTDNGYYAHGSKEREEIAAAALAPFEIDGWKGRADDFFNHHRRGSGGVRVTFTRYVAEEGEDP